MLNAPGIGTWHLLVLDSTGGKPILLALEMPYSTFATLAPKYKRTIGAGPYRIRPLVLAFECYECAIEHIHGYLEAGWTRRLG